MLVGEVSTMTEKPALAYGAPLEESGFESALMRFIIGGWCATPAWHGDTRARVVVDATGSGEALGLKAGSLVADGIPFLCDDKSPVVIFGALKKLCMGERKAVERCVRRERLEKKSEVGNGTCLENVEHDGINVGGNHVHHF